MLKHQIHQQITQHISDILSKTPIQDVEKNLKAVIMAIFSKLDLVTREEFEVAQKLLIDARIKIDQLEQEIIKINEKIK